MDSWLRAVRAAAELNFACNDRGLADATVRYVAHGEGPRDLLARVRDAARTVPAQLALHEARRADGHPHWPVYLGLAEVPPEVGLRWAAVAVSTERWNRRAGTVVDVAGSQLFDQLLSDIRHAAPRPTHQLPLRYRTLDALVVAAGGQPDELLVAAFTAPPAPQSTWADVRPTLSALDGFADDVERCADRLAPLAASQPRSAHRGLLSLLQPLSANQLGLFADALAACLTSDTASTALEADPMARRANRPAMLAALRTVAQQSNPTQRVRALRGIRSISDDVGDHRWAADAAAADPAPAVRAVAAELRSPTAPSDLARLLPVEETGWGVAFNAGLAAALQRLFDDVRAVGDIQRSRHPRWDGVAPPPEQRDWDHVVAQLRSASPPKAGRRLGFPGYELCEAMERFATAPGVDATAVFTVLHALGFLLDRTNALSSPAYSAFEASTADGGRPTLVELATRTTAVGLDGAAVVWGAYHHRFAKNWPADAVWPFVYAHLPLVLNQLTETEAYLRDDTAVYRALATLPRLPAVAVDALFTVALGGRARQRALAQETLADTSGIVDKVGTALRDGKGDVRAIAARWLGALGDPNAVPALEAALAAERNDLVKGALFDGLSALDQPLATYLDAATLDDEARRGMKSGLPKALAWLDVSRLPRVHWSSGEVADPLTVQWFLTLAAKSKSPEPDALMRHYCQLLHTGDRHVLASWVLDSWITADDRYHSGSTYQRRVSVIGAKGLLALVAACGGDDAVLTAHEFIYRHYGNRAAECRALLAMLAWTDSPQAVQTLLGVATKFRTKGLREEAEKQVHALAARRGWTAAELADRTAADGGFDTTGVLRLDYQPGDPARTFTATIQPDLTIVLRAADRKVIKSLPAPRQSDDQPSAAAAKKQLAATRKLLKSAATSHTERLYAAMCGQRAWRFADWATYLQRHPVVGQFTKRLVWQTDTEITFRPLDDGTLTDTEDDEVAVAPDAKVRVAHALTVPTDQAAAWRQHFSDYEVVTLFDQFRDPYSVPEEGRRARTLEDFAGVEMPFFTLRAAASPLGYVLGQAIDGPEIYHYVKVLPTIGLTVEVHFSGISVTQPNDPVTLGEASFGASNGASTRLGDLPSVLVSEVYNDLRQIAQTGRR